MINTPLETLAKDFKYYASSLAEMWLNLMLKRQYQEAGQLCINFIESYSFGFKGRSFEIDEEEYNDLLILLIFFKGLHEYVQLCQITEDKNWHEENEVVEHVWLKLCDCRERLEFSSKYCQGEAIERVFYDLDGLEKFFQDTFGNGSYFSPGMVADTSLCNICHQDCRACSHLAGRLYGGKICFYQPVNPIFNHVAIVKIPKDPRCRIWHWHIKDNEDESIVIKDACILTSSRVDDFLQDYES